MITAMPRIAIAVHDFDRALETFRDSFGMPLIDISDSSVDSLGARLGMCVPPGGSNIELMSPASADAPLSQSLQRFLERRGEGLFALMLEAPDPDAEARRLQAQGLNVLPLMAGAAGRDIHPSSTHGVLIRIYPVDSFNRQLDEGAQSAGLSGIMRVVIAVRDLSAATEIYGDKLGLSCDGVTEDLTRGVSSVICQPPAGGAIELIAVADASRPFAARVDEFLAARGEGMFLLVLQSSRLDTTADVLNARGVTVESSGAGLELDPRQTSGARLYIEASQSPAGGM